MKKLLVLFLTLALLIFPVSCQKNASPDATTGETVSEPIRVGYLAGPTGLGLAKMIADYKDNPNITFTQYNSPDEIMTNYAKGDIDFATLPTNGVPKYKNQMGENRAFLMLALNEYGVLYLLSDTGETIAPDDLSSLSGKTVYVPEQAPKLILQHILDENHVENVTLNMEYNLETLPAAVKTDENVHYILFPEPKVTVVLNQNPTFSIALDLTEAWDEISEEKLVQGCMIVSKSFAEANGAAVDAFLDAYGNSINWMKDPANLESAAQYAVDAGILPNAGIAKQAIPRCNLTFLSGEQMATTVNAYFAALGIAELPISTSFYGFTDCGLE